MKKTLFCAVALFAITCCYDDSKIWESINDYESRISELETILKAYEDNLIINEITDIGSGYKIKFSDGTSVIVYHGKDGDKGNAGEDGESYIEDILVGDTLVTFYLTSGEVFSMPLQTCLDITFSESDLLVMMADQTRYVDYSISSLSPKIEIEAISSADIKVKVVPSHADSKKGAIMITTTGTPDEYSKIVIIVTDGTHVIMRRLTFSEYGIGVYDNAEKHVEAEECIVDLEYVSSLPVLVEIPEAAKDWISVANVDTKVLEYGCIPLKIEENKGDSRETDVILRIEEVYDNVSSICFHITQKAGRSFLASTDYQTLLDINDKMGCSSSWSLDLPLDSWEGVGIDDVTGRVISLWLEPSNGVMPPSIGNLSELRELNWSGSVVSVPDEISKLTNLEKLVINPSYSAAMSGESGLSGELSKAVCSLKQLKYLSLCNNKLTDIPSEIRNLQQLEHLDLGFNQSFVGKLDNICYLTKLKTLDMYHNLKMTGGIPSAIGNLTDLEELNLGVTGISGKLPDEIGKLTKLRYFSTLSSGMIGELPASMSNLHNLEELHLGSCEYSGSIPLWFAELKKLKHLSLEVNNFSGPIPENLVTLPQLETFTAIMNNLTGTIPIGFGNIPTIKMVRLSSNNLTGTIPEDFGNIGIIWLYDNSLTGPVPEKVYKSEMWKNHWGQITVGNSLDLEGLTFPGPDFAVYKDKSFGWDAAYYVNTDYHKFDYTILFQWRAGCSYLNDAVEMLLELSRKYPTEINIIGWTYGDPDDFEAMERYGMTWTNYFSQQLHYPAYVSPTITVVDRDSMVVFSDMIQDRWDLPAFFEERL